MNMNAVAKARLKTRIMVATAEPGQTRCDAHDAIAGLPYSNCGRHRRGETQWPSAIACERQSCDETHTAAALVKPGQIHRDIHSPIAGLTYCGRLWDDEAPIPSATAEPGHSWLDAQTRNAGLTL